MITFSDLSSLFLHFFCQITSYLLCHFSWFCSDVSKFIFDLERLCRSKSISYFLSCSSSYIFWMMSDISLIVFWYYFIFSYSRKFALRCYSKAFYIVNSIFYTELLMCLSKAEIKFRVVWLISLRSKLREKLVFNFGALR
jgi:hypothetical protein